MAKITRYQIKKITQETNKVFLWQLAPLQGEIFNFQPGQFALIYLSNQDGGWGEKKPYSIASSPLNKDYLEFGIKTFGGFTHQMAVLKEGDTVGIAGPFGIFTYDSTIHQNAALFAGGIGITPFMSIIRFACQTAPDNKILLYYCNQTENDIAYKNTLDDLTRANSNLQIAYSIDQCIGGLCHEEIGLINKDKIKNHIANFKNRYFFLCGPLLFMKTVESILRSYQVPNEKIKKEVF